jgi:hypothetical protein
MIEAVGGHQHDGAAGQLFSNRLRCGGVVAGITGTAKNQRPGKEPAGLVDLILAPR